MAFLVMQVPCEGGAALSKSVGSAAPIAELNHSSPKDIPLNSSPQVIKATSLEKELPRSQVKERQSSTPSILSSGSEVDSDTEDTPVASGAGTPEAFIYGIVSAKNASNASGTCSSDELAERKEEEVEEEDTETKSMTKVSFLYPLPMSLSVAFPCMSLCLLVLVCTSMSWRYPCLELIVV